MPAGLQIWNEHGVLVLDGTHRLGRIKGMVRVGGLAGAAPMDLSDGAPFYSFQPDRLFFHISNETASPIFTINAGGVSWTYSSTAGLNFAQLVTGNLIFGVF
jgi:hypothetical protein